MIRAYFIIYLNYQSDMTEAGISNTVKHMLISALLPAEGMPVPKVVRGAGKASLGELCSN